MMIDPIKRVGMIVPSSNTVVEDVWCQIAPTRPDIRCHFARLSVTVVDQDDTTQAQFERQRLLAAANLLAELEPDCIIWAGTAAAWLGFDRDLELCDQIKAETGVPATTSLMAVNDALVASGARRIGLLTPYKAETEAAIIANYESAGFVIASKRRLDLTKNREFGQVASETLCEMAHEIQLEGVDAVAIVCTNLLGAPVVSDSRLSQGPPIVDSVLATFDAQSAGRAC